MMSLRTWGGKNETPCQVGDIVLVNDKDCPLGLWPMARVVELLESRDGVIRSCLIKMKDKEYKRPVRLLYKLETSLE